MHLLFKLMTYLKTKWFGVFLYNNEIIEKKLFPKNADEIAERLYKIQNGEILEEEEYFRKYKPVVDEKRLAKIGKIGEVKELEIKAEEYGYTKELFNEACIKLAMKKIRDEQTDRAKRIVEAVEALDDLIKVKNILLERVRSWYDYFSFEEGDIEEILDFKIGGKKLDKMEEKSIKNLAQLIISLDNSKKELENYIKKAMDEIAPNVSRIVGHGIAAKLIASAGGIEKLAMFPAGTIQLLGAEKALFRHIKDGSLPPKHGIIFQHELIHNAPKNKRGKLARLLATKISIAAKADAFTGNMIADELKKDIEKRSKEILSQ